MLFIRSALVFFTQSKELPIRIKILICSETMTVTNEDGGRQNVFAKEPPVKIVDVTITHNEKAEMLNGRFAMLGVIAALGAYALTGQLIPNIW